MSVPFSPLVSGWFADRFGTPTAAQDDGWPAIARGVDVLIAAPTGSGKTLAAFLWSIDRLLGHAAAGTLGDHTAVIYISPLKALGNDVKKNLQRPLVELGALADAAGTPLPEIRVVVRTGDTPASERHAMIRRPPHILVTTPESLYILLTAEKSRAFLRQAETVIVDEIHAIAGDKRGAHLALSLERLDALCGRPLQRIGLSATQRPIEEVGRLLVGTTRAAPTIVDVGHRRALDLTVEIPDQQLGPVATHELRDGVYERITELVRAHRTTLVFVNTRRLVERVAYALEKRLGADRVVAHHGSMARRTRLAAEERLKAGEVSVAVATASLELGIDVGTVDLVCHLGAPRALATLIQRVGRSGHARGAIPKGIVFPFTRDDLVQAAAAVRAVRAGELDCLAIPENALDIVAQQCVAIAAACGEIGVEELFALVRRAYPFRNLSRTDFDDVVEMLAEGVATRRGRRSAHLHHDRVHAKLRPRRGARLAAITSGGAIPDTADYEVIEEPAGLRVGTVNEDFAVESMAGDVFLLGNRSWRIRRVESGRVRVEDANGQSPTIPFWLGESPARTRELSHAVSRLRAEVVARPVDAAVAWASAECALSAAAAAQLVAYVMETQAALTVVPTDRMIVAERFFDEAGGMQLVVHAPFGARINRAFGLALRKSFCLTFDFELQAAATDDGILLSLGPQHSFPLDGVLDMLRRDTLEEDLTQAALISPMFTNRWRWNATRSLALLRHEGGRRVPMPLQRMRSDDLLAAVFPAQAACADNAPAGPIVIPDHPLVRETIGNCLREAMDVDGLRAVLAAVDRGEIATHAIDTIAPSPMSHEILNSNPYTFLDDAPLEERRARAVSLRQTDPQLAGGLGALDTAAIDEVRAQSWPDVRDADELHDVLLSLGLIPEVALHEAGWSQLGAALVADGRATWTSARALVAAERVALVRTALPGTSVTPAVQERLFDRRGEISEEDALLAIAGGWMECVGPITVPALAARAGLPPSRAAIGLGLLEAAGRVLRGRYTPGVTDEEWCDRRLLARIHRMTLGRLRREIEPVSTADFMRFLFRWQHLQAGTQLHGRHGLLEIIGQLAGYELPARAWEEQVLSARIARYDPDDLEHLCLSGAIAWGRLRTTPPDDEEPGPRRAKAPTRAAPLAFVPREDLSWLLDPESPSVAHLGANATAVLDVLGRRGASFIDEIARATRLLPAAVEEALWTLVAHGLVTGDGIAGLRALLKRPDETRRPRRLRAVRGGRRLLPTGRWALLRPALADEEPSDPMRFARQALRRYGVVVRELCARETRWPSWRALLGALRTLEGRGEIRGGRFVAGLVGEQFALPEAVDALRAVRRKHDEQETVMVAAADPLNLVGILLPGARVAANSRDMIAFRDGVPVAVGELGNVLSELQRMPAARVVGDD